MKSICKHIIPLYVIAFFGFGQCFAQTISPSLFAISFLKNSSHNNFNKKTKPLLENYYNTSIPEKETPKKRAFIEESEEENSEIKSFRKIIEKSYYFLTFFNHTTDKTAKRSLVFSKGFFYLSYYKSSLYLLFEVFRI